MKERSTTWMWGKFVMSFIRTLMEPAKLISSRRIGMPAEARPFPKRMEITILGLLTFLICFWVKSERSLGLKEKSQSIMTISSSVLGKVLTLSIRGALVPSVNSVKRIDSRNGGQFVLRICSTVAVMVVDKTGS